MTSRKPKRMNIRFRRLSDADLIERAAARSGLPVSEWTRRALIKTAEEQVHKSSILILLLKNVLLIRRILELAKVVPDDIMNAAKEWARIQSEDAVRVDEPASSDGGDDG